MDELIKVGQTRSRSLWVHPKLILFPNLAGLGIESACEKCLAYIKEQSVGSFHKVKS